MCLHHSCGAGTTSITQLKRVSVLNDSCSLYDEQSETLRTVACTACQSLRSINIKLVTHCKRCSVNTILPCLAWTCLTAGLRKLVCSDSSALTSPNLQGCVSLQHPDKSSCGMLGNLEVSSCLALQQDREEEICISLEWLCEWSII